MAKNDYEQLSRIPSPFSSFDPFSIGFDKSFKALSDQLESIGKNVPGYPPYNIKKVAEDKYVIELAVAGFREGDINVTVDKNLLTITGDKIETITELDQPQPEYVHRGISSRSFTRTFTLADHVEVVDATSTDGILQVTLERRVPEELKPKKIAITIISSIKVNPRAFILFSY